MGRDWVRFLAEEPPLGECNRASSWIGARSDTILSIELVRGRLPWTFTGGSVAGVESFRLIVRYLGKIQVNVSTKYKIKKKNLNHHT